MTTSFEDRLLHELRLVVAANPAPSGGHPARSLRRPLTVGGAVASVGVGTTALLLGGGSSALAAYTVEPHGDTVSVTVRSLTDAKGLQAKLNAAGVKAVVDYLPAGKTCRAGRFTPAQPHGPVTGSVRGEKDGPATFTFTRGQADETIVIESSVDAALSSLSVAYAQGVVAPCVVVDGSPAGPGLLPPPPGAVGGQQGGGDGPSFTRGTLPEQGLSQG